MGLLGAWARASDVSPGSRVIAARPVGVIGRSKSSLYSAVEVAMSFSYVCARNAKVQRCPSTASSAADRSSAKSKRYPGRSPTQTERVCPKYGLPTRFGPVFGGSPNCIARRAKSNCGTVFKLTPPAPGNTSWTESILRSFIKPAGGGWPQGGLYQNSSGALFGTTVFGGTSLNCLPQPPEEDCGTVFDVVK